MTRLFYLLIACCAIQNMQAQIHVLSHSPANMANSAPVSGNIEINFSEAYDPATINHNSVRVFGRWSGPMASTLIFGADNKSLTIAPDEPLMAGEWVTVNLARNIASSNGMPMSKGYSWNFWTATKPGALEQEQVDVLFLRQAGEGLIQTYGAYAGDLNNDGLSDFTVVNETSDDLRILLNQGAGTFSDFELIPMGNMSPSPNEGADFNNDGEIDFAVSTAHHNEVRVFFGDGSGSFTGPDVYTTGDGARGLSIIDCNGDGYDDIFITNRLDDNITLLVNDGQGQFTTSTMNTTGVGESACYVADANGDGILDVFIGMYYSKQLALLLGDGEGGFALSDMVTVTGSPWMIAAADFNGDGRADVASANSDGNRMAIAFGDGQGGLTEAIHFNAGLNTLFPLAIDLGDIDGDGDLEIVTSNYSSPSFVVFENDGNGSFTVASILDASNKASCAILHDRDGDGDMDISGTDEGDDVIILFENPGMPNATSSHSNAPFRFEIRPNPSVEEASLWLHLDTPGKLAVRIYQPNGQLLHTGYLGHYSEGEQLIELPFVSQLPTGVYFVQVQMGEKSLWKKLLR
ncbi:MAG TPA: FG-GAP-like repeat-containing protein [Saprospiraceae bacterium]|nr:FG-GAP-like repeat-containing protein [Saprospiraceae bacterium]HMQ83955.1 FG-GAP-like repeat-containing protein [Saprospiraceae bacterium]